MFTPSIHHYPSKSYPSINIISVEVFRCGFTLENKEVPGLNYTKTDIILYRDTGYRAVPDNIPENDFDYGEAYKDLPVCPVFKQIGELRGTPFG